MNLTPLERNILNAQLSIIDKEKLHRQSIEIDYEILNTMIESYKNK
jgi:hypothetical protein